MVVLALAKMDRSRAALAQPPPFWAILFASSAIFFLGGAASFGTAGVWQTALVGVAGSLASIAVIVVFSGRDRPLQR